jgi:hypothetical protein
MATGIIGLILMSVVFPAALTLAIFQFIGSTGLGFQKRVLAQGENALVKIVHVRPTNTTLANGPLARVLMEVHPSSGNAYRIERNLRIPFVYLARAQPGALLAARVDVRHREQVALDFERELTENERDASGLWASTYLEDLVSPTEQARRTRNRRAIAALFLIGAIVSFLLGLALVITASVA